MYNFSSVCVLSSCNSRSNHADLVASYSLNICLHLLVIERHIAQAQAACICWSIPLQELHAMGIHCWLQFNPEKHVVEALDVVKTLV